MFSKLKCFFPVANTPIQKITCIGVGVFIFTSCTYGTHLGINKYIDYSKKRGSIIIPTPIKDNKPITPSKLETILHKIGVFSEKTVLLPFIKTRDPYSVALSVPILGFYCTCYYKCATFWYHYLIDNYVSFKNTDQCCKLIRMSIIGIARHSIIAGGFLSSGYIIGYSIYRTSLNGYNIMTNKNK